MAGYFEQKYLWMALAAVVGVGILYYIGTSFYQPAVQTDIMSGSKNTNTAVSASTTPVETTETSSGFNPTAGKKTTSGLTYEKALTQYRDHRIQFNNCVADPIWITLKTNTRIMLDNRSADAQEIHLDRSVYRLAGYEFKIVNVASQQLPKTISIDCVVLGRPAYNIGEIYVQR